MTSEELKVKAQKTSMCQRIMLVFDDGSTATYVGRPITFSRSQESATSSFLHNRRVIDIIAEDPKPLPDGCSWETIL